ncbi:mucin-2 [Triticum aestivum]|uniref:mucin-2 n=1 Tax=Triticum aestivum TaxID=4565 RepID=UPI001D0096D6|nr:mucin-2-like [Triticum aestivum]
MGMGTMGRHRRPYGDRDDPARAETAWSMAGARLQQGDHGQYRERSDIPELAKLTTKKRKNTHAPGHELPTLPPDPHSPRCPAATATSEIPPWRDLLAPPPPPPPRTSATDLPPSGVPPTSARPNRRRLLPARRRPRPSSTDLTSSFAGDGRTPAAALLSSPSSFSSPSHRRSSALNPTRIPTPPPGPGTPDVVAGLGSWRAATGLWIPVCTAWTWIPHATVAPKDPHTPPPPTQSASTGRQLGAPSVPMVDPWWAAGSRPLLCVEPCWRPSSSTGCCPPRASGSKPPWLSDAPVRTSAPSCPLLLSVRSYVSRTMACPCCCWEQSNL